MIKPAILYKDELTKLFSEQLYTEDYFLYEGYPYLNEIPDFTPKENIFRYAITDNFDDNKVIGYLAYRIDLLVDTVCSFGLYSFDRDNPLFVVQVFSKMKELVQNHHRTEWRVIEGNPAKEAYDHFCERHCTRYNVKTLYLCDVTKDLDGKYRGEYIYEIINNDIK